MCCDMAIQAFSLTQVKRIISKRFSQEHSPCDKLIHKEQVKQLDVQCNSYFVLSR